MKTKTGSVAPKERINIVYKPSDGDAKEKIELPLRLMVLTDLTGKEDSTPLEEREVFSINRNNIDSVMKKLDVSMSTYVENTTNPDGEPLKVDLKFEKMEDFKPDAIAQRVPELSKMIELRESLVALKGPIGNSPSFRKAIQQKLTDTSEASKLKKALGFTAE